MTQTVVVDRVRAAGMANPRWSAELEGTWVAVGLNPNLLFNRSRRAHTHAVSCRRTQKNLNPPRLDRPFLPSPSPFLPIHTLLP